MTDKLDKVRGDAWNIASDYHLQLECEEQDIIKAEQTENPERQVFNLTEPHNRKTNEVVENWLSIPIPVEPDFPKTVCLCGSTRFKSEFMETAKKLTCQGCNVLAPFHFRKCGDEITPELERTLSELHLRKIDLADEVMILNVGGYIGESTRNELNYAKSKGKVIRYLEAIND